MNSNVYIYCRISSKHQTDHSLDAQEHACRLFAAHYNYNVVEVFTEQASGKDDYRPVLTSVLELARANYAIILVSKLDRISRDVSFIASLMKYNVPFITVELGNDAPPLLLHIYAAIAQSQREYISLRTKEALMAARRRGVQLGNPNWQDALPGARRAKSEKADAYALDMYQAITEIEETGVTTLQAIADCMNRRGLKSPRGCKFRPTTVRSIKVRLEQLEG